MLLYATGPEVCPVTLLPLIFYNDQPGADTIPGILEPLPKFTPASEDGVKESPKHVRQK
jgi:hypothetical protein